MMLLRLSMLIPVLWISTIASWLRADLLVFESDASEKSALAEMVSKNADLQNAVAAFERGDLPECERWLGKARDGEKDLPTIHVMLARLMMSKGNLNEAVARLELQLMKSGPDAEAHATLGDIALRSGRFTDAWLEFREALSILNTSTTFSEARKKAFVTQLLQRRAETAERRQDFATAQALYQELESAMPDSGLPLLAQARILIASGDIMRSAEILRRAKKLDASLAQPELQIAIALSQGTDGVATEKWFRDGIRQTETATIANWSEYLKWLLTRDRPEDVRLLIRKAPSSFQTDRRLRFMDGLAWRYLGKVDEAEKIFSRLVSENSSDLESADQLALILVDSIDQEKRTRAQQLCQNNLRQAPNEESAIATAAWVEFKLGASDVANQYFNTLIARGARNPQTVYYVAAILESRGREAEAMKLYQTAIEMPGLFFQRSEIKERLKAKANPLVKMEGSPISAAKSDAKPAEEQPVKASTQQSNVLPSLEKAK